jgi:hypothetical protein
MVEPIDYCKCAINPRKVENTIRERIKELWFFSIIRAGSFIAGVPTIKLPATLFY